MDRNKYLFKNTTIFAISNMSTKLIVFFLIPLYTWKLSTSEYGIVDLLFTISNFIYPLLTLNIVESIFRFSMDKNINSDKIIYNGIICNIICITFGLLVIPIMLLFKNYSDYAFVFYLYLISLSISQTFLAYLKGQEKLKLFAIGNVLNTIMVAILNILFLVGLNMSIYGYFWAYIIANVVTISFSLIFGKVKISFSKTNFDKKLFKDMLRYSVVLIPTSFMWWIINSSDRIMIASYVGDSANGLYGISYKIPSILTMIASIFNQAWVFSAINEKNSKDYEDYTNSVFKKLLTILCICSIIILIVIKPLFKVYVSSEFYGAWKYVPFLTFGFIFMTLGTFVSTSYNVHKDSKGFLYSSMVGAFVNIILNFIFIPFIGIYGAAFATLISYISIFVYRLINTRKYIKIVVGFEQISLLLLVMLIATATYFDNIIVLIIEILVTLMLLFKYRNIFIDIIKVVLKRK